MSVLKNNSPLISSGVCRCCRAVKKLRLLTHKYVWMDKEENYSDMLLDCFGLILSHLDGDQADCGICATCVVRLRDAYSFKIQVLKSEEMFLRQCISIAEGSSTSVKCEPEDVSDDNGADITMEIQEDSELNIEPPIKDEKLKADRKRQDKERKDITKVSSKNNKLLLMRKRKRPCNKVGDDVKRKHREYIDKAHTSTERRKPIQHDEEHMTETNLINLVENSYVCPFSNRFSCYFCFYCLKTFTKTDELRHHTSGHDPRQYKSVFKKRNYPKIDITRLDCRLCSEKIDNLDDFRVHITNMHNIRFYDIKYYVLTFRLTDGDLSCVECGSTFPFFDKLLNHMVMHYSKCTCDVCGKAFLNENNLKTHLLTHSKNDSNTSSSEFPKEFQTQKPISCSKCDDIFVSYDHRQSHMATVHGENNRFECSLCDKVYTRKRSLTEHCRRVHLKLKRHQCEFCSEKFFTPALLRDHMTTHTGEKNYSCQYCEKCYPRLKTLQQHLRIHANDRRYKCHVCSAAFVQNVSLKCHIKSHHSNFLMNDN